MRLTIAINLSIVACFSVWAIGSNWTPESVLGVTGVAIVSYVIGGIVGILTTVLLGEEEDC